MSPTIWPDAHVLNVPDEFEVDGRIFVLVVPAPHAPPNRAVFLFDYYTPTMEPDGCVWTGCITLPMAEQDSWFASVQTQLLNIKEALHQHIPWHHINTEEYHTYHPRPFSDTHENKET